MWHPSFAQSGPCLTNTERLGKRSESPIETICISLWGREAIKEMLFWRTTTVFSRDTIPEFPNIEQRRSIFVNPQAHC